MIRTNRRDYDPAGKGRNQQGHDDNDYDYYLYINKIEDCYCCWNFGSCCCCFHTIGVCLLLLLLLLVHQPKSELLLLLVH
jgi:hypothetical protein